MLDDNPNPEQQKELEDFGQAFANALSNQSNEKQGSAPDSSADKSHPIQLVVSLKQTFPEVWDELENMLKKYSNNRTELHKSQEIEAKEILRKVGTSKTDSDQLKKYLTRNSDLIRMHFVESYELLVNYDVALEELLNKHSILAHTLELYLSGQELNIENLYIFFKNALGIATDEKK
ncbi:MAG: hypothetical protein ABIH42_04820 [Planctomycetota bacterium]